MSKSLPLVLAGLLAAVGPSFAKSPTDKAPDPAKAAGSQTENSSDKKNTPPIDAKNMDLSVKLQEDFYLYANGNWIKNNPVPPEYSRWAAFIQLAERNNEALHKVAEKTA